MLGSISSPKPARATSCPWPSIATASPCTTSSMTIWDAAQMGPKRDVVGELEAATRAPRPPLRRLLASRRALVVVWRRQCTSTPTCERPANAGLYGPRCPWRSPARGRLDTRARPGSSGALASASTGLPRRLARAQSRACRRSIIPTSSTSIGGSASPRFSPISSSFAAYYYDAAANAATEGAGAHLQREDDFPANVATLDIERGKLDTSACFPGRPTRRSAFTPGATPTTMSTAPQSHSSISSSTRSAKTATFFST